MLKIFPIKLKDGRFVRCNFFFITIICSKFVTIFNPYLRVKQSYLNTLQATFTIVQDVCIIIQEDLAIAIRVSYSCIYSVGVTPNAALKQEVKYGNWLKPTAKATSDILIFLDFNNNRDSFNRTFLI